MKLSRALPTRFYSDSAWRFYRLNNGRIQCWLSMYDGTDPVKTEKWVEPVLWRQRGRLVSKSLREIMPQCNWWA